MPTLPRDTRLGRVRLRVADLDRQVGFYRDVLGLRVLEAEGRRATLGAARPLVVLEEEPGAPAPPRSATGLFHVALLLPGRPDLAKTLLRLAEHGWPMQGYADHAVSEAAYLADAEGNGLELYADRPRELWRWSGPELHITTEPLHVAGLLVEARGAPAPLPDDTVVGHVHLKVSGLARAEAFYVGEVGFEVTARAYPGALFASAAGYHHHLGMNVWSGAGAPAPPDGSRGLLSYDVVVPGAEAVRHARDPDGIEVRLIPGDRPA